MTITAPTQADSADWLPTYCPSWCDGEHARALEETGDLEGSRQHSGGGPGDYLREIRHAGASAGSAGRATTSPRSCPAGRLERCGDRPLSSSLGERVTGAVVGRDVRSSQGFEPHKARGVSPKEHAWLFRSGVFPWVYGTWTP